MIGTRIKELRIKNGLTQEDLAMRLLVSPQAVSKWERNLADPDIGLLIPIARIFGKTVDVLLSEVKQEVDIDAMVDCSAVLHDDKGKMRKGTITVDNKSNCTIEKMYIKVKLSAHNGRVINSKEVRFYDLEAHESSRSSFLFLNCDLTGQYQVKLIITYFVIKK